MAADKASRNAFGIMHHLLKAAASHFSPWSRSILTAAFLAWCIARTFLLSAILAAPHIDERGWVDRSLKPLWGESDYHLRRYYATHHPGFARLVYGAVLKGMGVYKCDRPLVIYGLDAQRWLEIITETGNAYRPLKTPLREALVSYAEDKDGKDLNIPRGAYPPLKVEMALRFVNVAFLAGMVAFIYLGFKRIFDNRLAALAGCLPVIFCYPIRTGPAPYIGVAPYIGTDSMLLFWTAAFWYTWLRTAGTGGDARRDKTRRGTRFLTAPITTIVLLGLVGGLMVSTKVNGAFTLLGACIYMAAVSRGARRLAWPALLCAIAFAVFLLFNPVYRAGDLAGMARRMRDVPRLMFKLRELTGRQEWGQFTRGQVMAYTFPYWVFYLPAAALVAAVWDRRWARVTAAWALPTILLNWTLIYVPFPRYAGPMAMTFLVLFAPAGIHLAALSLRSLERRGRLPLAREGLTG